MSYLVLARKYRPDSFGTVSGQEHVTRTLSNAINRNLVGHAYVFTGPRGVGKTSIARIFAKCLNCVTGPTTTPCLECQNCKEIAAGTSLAVREIDGASNNSVDNVRELIESFRTLPAPGSKYKVYIIDEVHMLSLSAFNALLKSLEEPPPNTVFILATTEPHKIPDTVLSRCQRHDLRALPLATIGARIEEVAAQEDFQIEPGAVKIIAKLAEGSMRDAQTLLERVRAYSDSTITTKDVSTILGSVDVHLLFELATAVFAQERARALQALQRVFEAGADEAVFLRELVSFFRELHLSSLCNEKEAEGFGITSDEYRDLSKLAKEVDSQDLADIADMVREGADKALRSSFPRFVAEALVVRITSRPPVKDIARMVGRLREMTKGGAAQAGATVQKKKSPEPVVARKTAPVPPATSRVTEKVSPESEVGLSANGAVGVDYSLEVFIQFLIAEGAGMVGELLRRVSVARFEEGVLSVEGPEFQVQSLIQPHNVKRIKELLQKFSSHSQWEFLAKTLRAGGEAAPGSLKEQEREALEKKREAQKDEMLGHGSLKSVLNAFPGSKVERVRFKRTT